MSGFSFSEETHNSFMIPTSVYDMGLDNVAMSEYISGLNTSKRCDLEAPRLNTDWLCTT